VRILVYHHVVAPTATAERCRLPWTLYTEAGAFARQMRYIGRHYRPTPLPDVADRLASGRPLPPGSVAITLDDGYADQILHALPALIRAGIPATLAIVADRVITRSDDSDTRAGAAEATLRPHDGWGEGERFATAEQLRAAQAHGITLASHSLTHPDLTACSRAALECELLRSRDTIRALGDTGHLFCYPRGMYNAAVRTAVAAAGYRVALTCDPGANTACTDPLLVRRIQVGASPDHFVAAQLSGLLDGPAWLYHWLNRLRLTRVRRQGRSSAGGGTLPEAEPVCHCAVPPLPITPPLSHEHWPKVTIVVPTYNEQSMIDRCLQSILTQDYPPDRLEVLVIDAGSTDDTVTRARRYPGVRVIANPARDAETAKEIGLREARSDLFMYLDADAEYTQAGWLMAMVGPLRDDPTLVASFTRFVARPHASPLERYLNYHPLQLGPLLRELCVEIGETLWLDRATYAVCCFSGGRVPPIGLCLYRVECLRAIAGQPGFRWIDIAIPVLLAQAGHAHFAYVPHAGIYHGRPAATLRSLVARQQRNVVHVYFPTFDTRAYRYVEFSSPREVTRLLRWVVGVNLLLLPLFVALRDSWRWRDLANLYGFPLAVLEANAVALEFLRHERGRALLRQGLGTVGRAAISYLLPRKCN
jgi:glycosyltransferase involved in cell wall biosynthesis/peptidoglycan/xylan/chitin deacetylase (PgdA/CDA1 family)